MLKKMLIMFAKLRRKEEFSGIQSDKIARITKMICGIKNISNQGFSWLNLTVSIHIYILRCLLKEKISEMLSISVKI